MAAVRVCIELDDGEAGYFESCARMRKISIRSLFRRLASHIAQDQMIGGILDDQDEFTRRKGEHAYKGPRAP